MEEDALSGVGSEDAVVPQKEVKALEKQIRQLERMLGKKTLENEILKEAVKIGREKNWSRDSHCKEWKVSNKSHSSSF